MQQLCHVDFVDDTHDLNGCVLSVEVLFLCAARKERVPKKWRQLFTQRMTEWIYIHHGCHVDATLAANAGVRAFSPGWFVKVGTFFLGWGLNEIWYWFTVIIISFSFFLCSIDTGVAWASRARIIARLLTLYSLARRRKLGSTEYCRIGKASSEIFIRREKKTKKTKTVMLLPM